MPELLLIIFYTLLLLLLAGSLIFLFLQSQKSLREHASEQAGAMSTLLQIQIELTRSAGEAQTEWLKSAQSSQEDLVQTALSTVTSELQRAQTSTTKALEQTHLISMNGLQASESTLAKILASTLAMLGTKDTLAYNTVMGAAMPQDTGTDSYTSVDEAAELNALEKDAALLLESMGVSTNESGEFGEYSSQS